jgi:uncharacterized protein YcfL
MNKPLLASLLAFVLVGCNTVKPPIQGRQDVVPPQVSFASQDLSDSTAVSAPRFARDANGILFCALDIRSASNYTLHVQYRATFFDRNGMQVYQTGWLRKTLQANTPDQIVFNSLNSNIADVQIALRYAE